jgi:hypothetical protein
MIPPADPIALPAPVGLLHGFLLLGFLVHVIPMSVTLGGGFWAIVAARRARSDPAVAGVAYRLSRWLPVWTAATVSSGVAVLLFLQTLYGQLFFAAAVAIAWPWLAVVGMVLAGYYGYYFVAYRNGGAPWWVGAVAWFLFVLVGFVYTNQMTLMLSPKSIVAIHAADPSGWNLNLGDATVWPRYLHMLIGAVAVAALWVGALGAFARNRGESGGDSVLGLGARGFVIASAVQVLTGLWWALALPGSGWRLIFGGQIAATLYVAAGLLLVAGAALVVWRAPGAERPLRSLAVGAAFIGVVILLMVLLRDVVRRDALAGMIDLGAAKTAPQWGAIAIFSLLVAAALITIGWMVVRVVRARH